MTLALKFFTDDVSIGFKANPAHEISVGAGKPSDAKLGLCVGVPFSGILEARFRSGVAAFFELIPFGSGDPDQAHFSLLVFIF